MFDMNKGEDWRNKGDGKPVIKYGKELKEGEAKGKRDNGEKEKREVTKEGILQRPGESSVTVGQIGGGERRCKEGENGQTGGVKWGTYPTPKEGDMPPKYLGGHFMLRSSWDMPPSPKQGQMLIRGGGLDISPSHKQGMVLIRGGGWDIPPSPIREKLVIQGGGWDIPPNPKVHVRGGGLDTRMVVLLLSALLAASLPQQGNSH